MEDEFVLNVEVDDNGTSMETTAKLEKLRKQMMVTKDEQAKLKKEYDAGNVTMEKYIQENLKLDTQLKKLNKTFADTEKQAEKTNTEFKQTAETLVDKVMPGLAGATKGTYELVVASLKFIATPIGAVLALLVGTIALLKSYFTGSAEGQDKWNRITNVAAVIFGKFREVLQQVGEWIYEYGIKYIMFYVEVYEKLANILGINTQVIRDYFTELEKAADKISTLQEQIKLWERILILQREQVKASIADMKLKMEDKNTPLKERIELSRKVQKEIEKQMGTEVELARMRLEAYTLEMQQGPVTHEQLTKQAELEAEMYKLQKEAADQKKEAFTKELAFIKELHDLRIKQSEEERELRIQRYDDELQDRIDAYEKRMEFEEQFYAKFNGMTKRAGERMNEETKARQDKETKQKEKDAKKQLEIEKMKNEAIMGGIDVVAEKHKTARIALNMVFKQNAMQEIIANTETGAIAAFKSMAGIPIVGPALGALAAGLVIAYGAARLSAVAGVRFFAKGGKANKEGTFNGPGHSQGGITYWGSDGNVINVEGGENFYVLKKSASEKINSLSSLNMSEGGNSFGVKTSYAALGGSIATRAAATQQISNEQMVDMFSEAMSNMQIVVPVEDISKGLAKKAQVIEKANLFR